jgi:hypothetical protein
MLPGFRFLFAAIVLSMAMLIFGLGAAALLRAAHREFVSIPSWPVPPQTLFAGRQPAPALAMLRVDAPAAAEEKATNLTTSADPQISAPTSEQGALTSSLSEQEELAAAPDGIAAQMDTGSAAENPSPLDAPKLDTSSGEIPALAEELAPADAPSPAAEVKLVASAEMIPTAPKESAAAAPDQAAVPLDDGARIAETRITTLGGPAVRIETKTASKMAPALAKKSAPASRKKSAQASRTVKRHKVAQRLRPQPQSPQQPPNLFGTPFGNWSSPGK